MKSSTCTRFCCENRIDQRFPRKRSIFHALLCVVLTSFLLSGCAIKTGSNGRLLAGLDIAEVLGNEAGTFSVPGGAYGTLRVLNGQYSLKVGNTKRQLTLGNIISAKILQAGLVGDRTIVFVDAVKKSCEKSVLLFAIKGFEVEQWSIGDCRTPATVEVSANESKVIYKYSDGVVLYNYKDGALERSVNLAPLASNPENQSKSLQAKFQQSSETQQVAKPARPPSARPASPPQDSPDKSHQSANPASAMKPVTAPPKPSALIFSKPEKQASTRIVLD